MHIKICRSDGGVSIMEALTDDVDAEVAKWQGASGLTAVSYAEIDPATVPQDRTFRAAWNHDLAVDMPKAREIHMGRIRAARDDEMKRLDIEQLKGKDVVAQKQKLRDLPQTFDLTKAGTPEALKTLWPAELPK